MTFGILVAEDEEITLKHLLSTLEREGYEVSGTDNGQQALEKLENEHFDLLIADIKMPGLNGIELLEKVKAKEIETEVMIITGFGSIKSAVETMQKGACDYITKPFDLDELMLKVKRTYDRKVLQREVAAFKASLGIDKKIPLIAKSESMRKVFQTIEGIKNSDCNVLLTGESGVGKSIVARTIHFTGRRKNRPFLSINCATLTEHLLASELFGHEKGAFTGAVKTKQGLVEVSDTGTLFLDEIAEMSPNMQAKLLKVLEDGEFYRVGGTKPFKVDVRFIAATNQNISALISEGKFRKDFYYRLNVMEIFIASLLERKEDIKPLSMYFFRKHVTKQNKKIKDFTKPALEVLLSYSFPGNIRELENIIERAVILEKGPLITPESLPQSLRIFHIETSFESQKIRTIDELNKDYAEHVVEMLDGNKSKAAELLGISRTSLWRILNESQRS
ncbi:MAG: sigma-54 dependent transcriptional regulator [Pseudomonadota bacterium]